MIRRILPSVRELAGAQVLQRHERYWPGKCHHADLTLLEYRTVLERDVLACFRGWTLEQIVTAGELAAAGYAAWLRDRKTVNGVFHSAAYDKALNIAGAC